MGMNDMGRHVHDENLFNGILPGLLTPVSFQFIHLFLQSDDAFVQGINRIGQVVCLISLGRT